MCSRRGGTMGIEVAQGVCPDDTSIITRHAPLHPAWSRPTSPGRSAQDKQARIQLSSVQRLALDNRAVDAALLALPTGQRKAITLLKLQERSLKEASEESGMSIASLKVSAHWRIKALRRLLCQGGD